MSVKRRIFAGGDLGGTTTKMVLVDEDGKILAKPIQVQAAIDQGLGVTFPNMDAGLRDLCNAAGVDRRDIAGIGFATPGPATREGFIKSSANLNHPDWKNVDIAKRCSMALDLWCIYANDANAAGNGEFNQMDPIPECGVYVAPGTGLGAIDVQKGIVNPGKFGFRCELGHVMIPREVAPFNPPVCGCGGEFCVERILSLGGLEYALNNALEQDEWQGHDFLKPEFPKMSTRDRACRLLRHTWATRDPLGMKIFSAQAEALGWLYYDIVVHFDPDVVVVGGGWSDTDAPQWFHDMIIQKAGAFFSTVPLIQRNSRPFELTFAKLGDYAGAIGAANYARANFVA